VTHRAAAIIDAAAALIRARVEPLGIHVYTHRRHSLNPGQDEMPAISVDMGEDIPGPESTSSFDSLLNLEITGVAALPTEPEVTAEIIRLREEAHIALRADVTLGLPYVVNTLYGGAARPTETESEGELVVRALTSVWIVYYQMSKTDPGG